MKEGVCFLYNVHTEVIIADLVTSQCSICPIGCPFSNIPGISIPAHKTLSESFPITFTTVATNE